MSSFRERGKERVRQGYSLFITDRVRASRSADPKVPVSRVNLLLSRMLDPEFLW